jgi:hypothetical protein
MQKASNDGKCSAVSGTRRALRISGELCKQGLFYYMPVSLPSGYNGAVRRCDPDGVFGGYNVVWLQMCYRTIVFDYYFFTTLDGRPEHND